MDKKININLPSLLIVFVFLLIPLAYTHTATLPGIVLLGIALALFNFFGDVLISHLSISNMLLPLSRTCLSVLTGGTILSLLIFVSVNPLVTVALSALFCIVLFLFYRKHTVWTFTPDGMSLAAFVIAMAVIALISPSEDLMNEFTPVQGGYNYAPDTYFFTSIVASMRHGTIYSAVYEVNTPVNYQLLGFLLPSFLANLLHISSHQALWGLTGPFYKLLCIVLCYDVCYYYCKDKVGTKNYLFLTLALTLPVLLAPLHPLYVLKGNLEKAVFNGLAYIVPSGVITYPLSFALFLLDLLLFSAIDWRNRKFTIDKAAFVICLSLLIIAKFFVLLSFLFFLGFILLKRIVIDKEKLGNYLWYGVGFAVLSVIFFKLCIGKSTTSKSYMAYGYLTEVFASWYNRTDKGLANNLIAIGLILFSYIIWIGLRWVGLIALGRSQKPQLREFSWAALLSLIGTTLFSAFFRFQVVYSSGKVLMDNNFNALGFIRASFYVLTIIATIGIVYLLYNVDLKPLTRKIYAGVVAAWCTISCLSVFYTGLYVCIRQHSLTSIGLHGYHSVVPWYTDNYNELKKGRYSDGLIAVNPNNGYGGMISSSDYGTYWTARSGFLYNCSNTNDYRWLLFQALLDQPQEQQLAQMKREGVKYIIATPGDAAQIEHIAATMPYHLHKLPDTKWVYQLD